MKKFLIVLLGSMFFALAAMAQNSDVAAILGYPETILYNGKIVTMDDASFDAKVGTIVQAMAVRGGKILATGTNAKIQSIAGPQTKKIDLKGRTVMPSFILTHEHPTDWTFIEPRAFNHVLPNDDVIISRWLPSVPPKEQLALFEPTMREAVAKAKPGQWIRVLFNYGEDYQWATELIPLFRKSVTKAWLDDLAPNNPVTVKDGFINSVANAKAIDEFATVHPDINFYESGRRGGQRDPARESRAARTGMLGRPLDPDAMLKGKLPVLADLLKSEMDLWASWGVTTFGSSPYAHSNLQAIDWLDKRGLMTSRFAWGYTGPAWDLETLRVLAATQGHGTDHMWMVGAWSGSGSGCMTVPERPEWKQIKAQMGGLDDEGGGTKCAFAPGAVGREIMERIVESGLRIATMHTGGDKDIDYYMDAIEAGMKKGGYTLDEIRSRRYAFDHGAGAPRPEQVPRMKNLGMLTSEINTILWETHRGASIIAKQYGVEYTSWVVPRKRLTEAQIPTGFEIDRPLPHKIFFFILKGMNRFNDRDQKTYGPDQKTDRIIQLKALTRWGAYYLLRENTMGTLEPGKVADYIVLDKDILTVPEDQIPSIQVLMTSVGGKVVHLRQAFASEIGMPAAGATTWKETLPKGWD